MTAQGNGINEFIKQKMNKFKSVKQNHMQDGSKISFIIIQKF